MKLIYVAFYDFENESFGPNAKIKSHCKVFSEYGYDVELVGRKGLDIVSMKQDGSVEILGHCGIQFKDIRFQNLYAKYVQMNAVSKYVEKNSFGVCYVRYEFSNGKFIGMMKKIRKQIKNVFLELPTYPYDAENNIGFLNKIKMFVDRKYRGKLKGLVDYVVTFYGGYDTIFGNPVIVIPNGFDFSKIQCVSAPINDEEIHIMAVSAMREWHGYERIIEGMNNYYQNDGTENFVLHLVGNGREYGKYKELIEKYHLADRIVLEGPMFGEQLKGLFEKCAIGIDSLARHRSGISVLSSLKSREYGAYGIPIINSCDIDIIESDFPYFFKVPADESPISMEDIACFYHKCFEGKNRSEVAADIRNYIENKSNMKSTMRKVVDKIKE